MLVYQHQTVKQKSILFRFVKEISKENMKTKEEKLREKVVKSLKELQSISPNQRIYVETPNKTASCRLGDAHIFETIDGQIAIDSE